MNTLEKFEKTQIDRLVQNKEIPDFGSGDTVRVNVRIVEGDKERIQAFEGICIGRKKRGINSSFTVRKISNGEGVERIFPLYSPRIDSIKVVRRGDVRRAKLYYMRELSGKAARIQEKRDFSGAVVQNNDVPEEKEQKAEETKAAPEKKAAPKAKAAKKDKDSEKKESKKAAPKKSKASKTSDDKKE